MKKIISDKSETLRRLKYLCRISIMVNAGELSEEDAVEMVNAYHGRVVLTCYPK